MRWLILTLLTPALVVAQDDFLSNLTATQIGNLVRIDFTVAAGTSYCLGVDLERSTDSLNFESIGFLPGVCGGSEFEESYVMTDSVPPVNRRVYYRLEMGLIGKSDVVSLVFVELDNGVRLFPNPANTHFQLYFDNPNNLEHNLRVYDNAGRLVHSESGSQRLFEIFTSPWRPGTYVVELLSDSRKIQRLLVIY